MMKSFFLLILLINGLFSQIDMDFSYEMQYGNGKQVIGQASDDPKKEEYSYFQNILDMNTHLGDNIYIYTQLEYSNPPIYGYNRTTLDSLMTSFYLEFSNEKLNVKIGDQYELYGRGLSYFQIHMSNQKKPQHQLQLQELAHLLLIQYQCHYVSFLQK